MIPEAQRNVARLRVVTGMYFVPPKGQLLLLLLGAGWWEERIWDQTELGSTQYQWLSGFVTQGKLLDLS